MTVRGWLHLSLPRSKTTAGRFFYRAESQISPHNDEYALFVSVIKNTTVEPLQPSLEKKISAPVSISR